jgi:DUF1009 family protein
MAPTPTSVTTKTEPLSIPLAPGDRVAVVAGSGRLPVDVVEGLRASGHTPLVLAVEGEADAVLAVPVVNMRRFRSTHFIQEVARIRREGFTHMVLAGGISHRPALRDIPLSFTLLRFLPRVLHALSSGDDGLLGAIVKGIEGQGIKVVGAHQIVPDLLARGGVATRARPGPRDERDMRAALQAARTLGALDIGQAAVAIGGRAIALEDIDGTDSLLQRVRALRDHGRLAGRTGGVLAKCAKPGQEVRADLPAIGPSTVEAAHAAGLAGIAVHSGAALILDRAATIERADALGLFIAGIDVEGRS